MVTTATDTSRRAFACLTAAIAALLLMAPAVMAASPRMDRVERSVVKRFNALRADAGLPALRRNRALARAADTHSRDMVSANFFAHSSSNGNSMAARVHAFRRSALVGEVLAYLTGHRRQARAAVREWRRSPPHRATILTPGLRRVGVARRSGRIGDARFTVFTADFASAR